jgi:hypothetical protein
LDQLHLLHVGKLLGTLARLLGPLPDHFLDQFLDLRNAAAAAATGLGEMGDLLRRCQVVGLDHLFEEHIGDAEAFADNGPLLVGIGRTMVVVVAAGRQLVAAVLGNGNFQRFLSHDRAVHLLLRQATQEIGDVLVADGQGLVQGLALDHLGQGR